MTKHKNKIVHPSVGISRGLLKTESVQTPPEELASEMKKKFTHPPVKRSGFSDQRR